jgi:hypothetical protein
MTDGYRGPMPKTTADEWFERYLLDHGLDPGEHEPDLSSWGVETHPDYLPTGDAGQIACEVKQFGKDSKLAKRLAEQRYVAASDAEVYGPIRNQVAEAAGQLKPLASRQMPLVVVLANPEAAPVDLSFEHVIAALYGNPQWTVAIDPSTGGAVDEGRFELGRDGKLTNDHAYISAVALLRRGELALDARDEILAELRDRHDGEAKTAEERQQRAVAAIKELERHDLPDGHYFYVEVIEALSKFAVPLPEAWFAGERDRRWRCNSAGYYEVVHGSLTPGQH